MSTPVTAPVPEAAAAAAPPPVDTAALEARIAELKAESDEAKRAAQYWHEQTKKSAPARVESKAADPEDEEDILAVLAEKGGKGLDAVLAKRGYVRGSEVDAKVETRARQIAKEAELTGRYSDLKDASSEFFKLTAQAYGHLKEQGVSESIAMELAAERTELALLRSGKLVVDGNTSRKKETESERVARVSAQAGERGPRPSRDEPDEGDDEITDMERKIIQGMGITEDAFRKRAKAGVQMMRPVSSGRRK